jgi:hypothetical protein
MLTTARRSSYYDNPKKALDKIAFTITGDAGCEYGGGGLSRSPPAMAL